MNINSPDFEGMVTQTYPTEQHLNKAYCTDTEASFFRFAFISFKPSFSAIYDKYEYLGFDMVNFPFFFSDGDVPRVPSYSVNISILIRFAKCLVIWLISMFVTKL